jgi:hypothetical protein
MLYSYLLAVDLQWKLIRFALKFVPWPDPFSPRMHPNIKGIAISDWVTIQCKCRNANQQLKVGPENAFPVNLASLV